MHEKKNTKSPDVKALQAVVIDARTRIYIPMDADPEEAKSKYLSRIANRKA